MTTRRRSRRHPGKRSTSKAPRPLRILFLDFDGVLNSGPYMRTWIRDFYVAEPDEGTQSQTERFEMDAAKLDTQAIDRVNRIVAATGARIVVCSSWRHFHPLSRLRRLLRSRGFAGPVVGVTPAIPGAVRGDECVAWLAAHPRAAWSFAALDDDNDYGPMMDRLVRTSTVGYRHDGLKEKHVAAAIKLLLSPAAKQIAAWRRRVKSLTKKAVHMPAPPKLLPLTQAREFVDAMYLAHGYSNVVKAEA
jgi:HAD domain in Swiss Army Knife RNA repair proteins